MKHSGTLTATPETSGRSGSGPAPSADSAVKQQAVALDIPVTVNGARTIEGRDKREPFSESTKTVLVFGSGAVIRLSSPMAPGQLLFLTNERSKKEVVCQVVKSKNHRNLSGYVELEFTEPAVGFWGMRFPGDRLSSGPQAAPAAPRPPAPIGSPTSLGPVAAKIEQAGTSSAPSNAAAKTPSPGPVSSKPASGTAPGSSIVPPPLDSAALLEAAKRKGKDPAAPVAPRPMPLTSEEKLVEPWLKKPQPVSQARSAPPIAASPESTANPSTEESNLPVTPTFELSRAADKPASILAPSEPPPNLSGVDLSSIVPFFEVKPTPTAEAPPAAPQVPAANDVEMEELKEHTARLREKLSSMQFAEPVTSSPLKTAEEIPSIPLVETSSAFLKTNEVHESAVQLLENSGASKPAATLPEPLEHEKIAPALPASSLEALEQEELKIPAWLEPLARNTAAPTSAEELILREKAKRIAEQPQLEEITAELAVPTEPEPITKSRAPRFGSTLPTDEAQPMSESSSERSGRWMLFAAAAVVVLLLAGTGWWYMNQQSAGVNASVPATQAAASSAATTLQTNPQADAPSQSTLPARADVQAPQASSVRADSLSHINSTSNFPNSPPAGLPATAVRGPQLSSNSLSNATVVTRSSSTPSEQPLSVETKKPSLGDVHLAPPKIANSRHTQNGAGTDAGLALDEVAPETDADNLNSGLGIANNRPTGPAAPVVVGGDVKPAKLLSSVAPVYPALASAQHVSGNVTIDALVDARGQVTSMKVISGPPLLQQAAMDALRQWKYRPATLDGKAVPMHLSITIQFHLK